MTSTEQTYGIKPLEWNDDDSESGWPEADSIFGKIVVWRDTFHASLIQRWIAECGEIDIGETHTEEAAKLAAEQWYIARLLPALTTKGR